MRSIPPLPGGGPHPLGLLDFLPKGWECLIFSGCDPQDKRKDVGNMLTWKAKGKKPNLTGHDCLPSLSDDEDEMESGDESFKDEVGREMGSLTKGKGKSANSKGDNNTVGPQMDDPYPDEGSQEIQDGKYIHE